MNSLPQTSTIAKSVLRISRRVAAPCAVLALAALTGQANAVTALTITDVTTKGTTQPQDIQCLFIGNSCPLGQQAMDYYDFSATGSISSYDLTALPNHAGSKNVALAPDYTVDYLASFVGRVFNVGIDVNTTSAQGETLTAFDVAVNGTVIYDIAAPKQIGLGAFNGNGFFDWTLSTIDLSQYAGTDKVTFHAAWDNASDGPENFFLYKGPVVPVPEPGTYALMLAGLGVVGFMARRRKLNT